MDEQAIAKNWWPISLESFASEKPLGDDYVVVAEISKPWGSISDKVLYTALVPTNTADSLRVHEGAIGFEVDASGPWPSPFGERFRYDPEFWIHGSDQFEALEPLVVAWQSAGKTILIPDQGFLMTYGLLPRHHESGETSWDDPANHVFDVVKVGAPSEFHYTLISETSVLIRREYLVDYATVRDRCIFQTFFVSNCTDSPDPVTGMLIAKNIYEIRLPQKTVFVRPDSNIDGRVIEQVTGYRQLVDPGDAPVSHDSDYGVLDWPGVGKVDGTDGGRIIGLPEPLGYVYVNDSVLGEYEGSAGFNITPMSGAVSYGGQWSVANTRRIGRNLIQVELGKLYDCKPRTVKTWHKYCTTAPVGKELEQFMHAPNVASRAKTIVYSMVTMGEALADIITMITSVSRTSNDLVRLDRGHLDYYGWWNDDIIETIARHAPQNMTEESFMDRCVSLYKVVGESLAEKHLRKALIALHVDEEEIREFRSLKLLDLLLQLAILAKDSGLNLIEACEELLARREQAPQDTAVRILAGVNELRAGKSHRKKDIEKELTDLGIDRKSMESGWGAALDIVYDRTSDAISEITRILIDCMPDQ